MSSDLNGLIRVGKRPPKPPDPWWLLPLLCIVGPIIFWIGIAIAAEVTP